MIGPEVGGKNAEYLFSGKLGDQALMSSDHNTAVICNGISTAWAKVYFLITDKVLDRQTIFH